MYQPAGFEDEIICKEENMGPEFFRTRMGQIYYEVTLPRIADSLEKISKSLETIASKTDSIEEIKDELAVINDTLQHMR